MRGVFLPCVADDSIPGRLIMRVPQLRPPRTRVELNIECVDISFTLTCREKGITLHAIEMTGARLTPQCP